MDTIFFNSFSRFDSSIYFFVVVIVVLCIQPFLFVFFSFNGSCLFLTPYGQGEDKELRETGGQM